MRIFVTGASGWIGRSVTAELVRRGIEVVGLARSKESAEIIQGLGGIAVTGDLADLSVVADLTRESDGVIHLAFRHDLAFSGGFAEAISSDRAAVEAMAQPLMGSDKPFIAAAGLLGSGRIDGLKEDELIVVPPQFRGSSPFTRNSTGLYILSLAGVGVRSAIVRFPPTVHGDGDRGFVKNLHNLALSNGHSSFVGDGVNRWSAVHISDAASLLAKAVQNVSPGTILHAVGEEGVPFREIASAIGGTLDLPTISITQEEAQSKLSYLATFAAMDGFAHSTATRIEIEWQPTGPTLLEDINSGVYIK
ncbi:MAG: SDR family oxidoreductase [Actinomycetota bacterium]|nr:SDR family oxidoreductase [Actinomycetota bacterium]